MATAIMPLERDTTFVGRVGILAQMRDEFEVKRWIVLTGEEFIGKTHITIEYVYQLQELHPTLQVFWCPASTPEEFSLSYKAIARRLSLISQANTFHLVQEWLEDESHGPWVLIVDGADRHLLSPTAEGAMLSGIGREGVVLSEYLPKKSKHGQVVVTTSDDGVAKSLAGEEGLVIPVPQLTPEEAAEMLHRKVPQASWSESESGKVIEALGYYPLTVRIAGAFITENGLKLPEYLNRIQALEPDVGQGDNNGDHWAKRYSRVTLIRACSLSIDQIHEETPRAAEILFLMSALDGHSIPKTLLMQENENPRQFNRAIATLQSFSLITLGPDDATFTMASLAQIATMSWLSKRGLLRTWQAAAVELLAQRFPLGTDLEWSTCETLYRHVKLALTYIPQTTAQHLSRATILLNLAEYHSTHGHYTAASTLLTEALSIQETHLSASHVDTLLTANKLSELLSRQGNYPAAEERCRQTLSLWEETLGPSHPHTITSISNLAVLLQDQSRYADSEILHRRALALNEEVRGPDALGTLTSLNNLAILLNDQGRFLEAEPLLRRSLEGSVRLLGAEDAGTLLATSNLAKAMEGLGKTEEAEKMNREVLVSREALLGAGHPDTLTSVNNLAALLSRRGMYDEAEMLHRRALEGRERVLGPEHPITLESLSNLALAYTYLAKYAKAEEMYRKTVEARKRVSGEEHISTVIAMNNLAGMLGLQGNYGEAEALHRKCLVARKKLLGPAHTATLGSMNNLAKVLLGQGGKLEEAESLLTERLKLGKNNGEGDTASSMMSQNNLGLVAAAQGKAEEAERIHRGVLEARDKLLGEYHPDTLTSAFNLATVLHELKKYDEAAALYERAYEGRKKMLRIGHPDIEATETVWRRMDEEMTASEEKVVKKDESPAPSDTEVKGEDLVLPVRPTQSM